MKKYITEFIGAFFLVFTVVLTINNGTGNLAPLAIGSALMVMVFAGGHISGAHYNPAVTIAVYLRGRCELKDVPGYIIAQILGGAAASLLAQHLLGGAVTSAIKPLEINMIHAFAAELMGTFALCYVVLNVATSKSTANNFYYGLAIGFTVLAMAFSLGGISGGAFNPAVLTGVCISGNLSFSTAWVHVLAEVTAAIVAAFSYKFLYVGHTEI